MAKGKSYNERWNVSYCKTDSHNSDTIKDLTLSWENLDSEGIKQNLNMFLAAIGAHLEIIDKK